MMRRLILFLLMGCLGHGSALAEPIGFGAVEVSSGMGEPLHVKIPILPDADTPGQPHLKKMEALWGVPTNYAHPGGPNLSVSAQQQKDGRGFLIIDSNQGMTIPFFTLLLKIFTEDRVIVRNFPIVLGEHGNDLPAKASTSTPNPPVIASPPVAAVVETHGQSSESFPRLWKNIALGVSALALFTMSFLSLRNKRRANKWGITRGEVRKRPMAVPVPGRLEGMTPDHGHSLSETAPGWATNENAGNGSDSHSKLEPTVVLEELQPPTAKSDAKGVTINTTIRKQAANPSTPTSKT
ncbi:MAG: hypothetical protein HQL73_04095 [Magnetococcales bacterium]|nr:hypothetical protein [Magnetococcales bacterium]